MKSLRRDPRAAEQVYSNFFNDLRHLILSIIFQLGQLNEEQTCLAFSATFENTLCYTYRDHQKYNWYTFF